MARHKVLRMARQKPDIGPSVASVSRETRLETYPVICTFAEPHTIFTGLGMAGNYVRRASVSVIGIQASGDATLNLEQP